MPSRRIHLILIAAQVCFASLAVAGRMALGTIPADAIVWTRMAGGLVVFTLWARTLSPQRIARADYPMLVACALLGVVFNMTFFIHGLARSTATNATVLGSTIPVFTALFAVLLGREVARAWRVAGIAIALSGALVLNRVWNLDTGREHLIGNGMVLFNAASYGLYLVLVKPLAEKYPPMTLIAALFLVATVVMAPFGVTAWVELAPRLGMREVGFLLFILAVPTVGAYALTQVALRRAESTLVASYIYMQPVLATVGAVLLLDERPGPLVLAAAGLIVGGVWVSARRS